MSFRLVQISIRLNDLERRSGFILRYVAELSSFQGPYVKVAEDSAIHSASEM